MPSPDSPPSAPWPPGRADVIVAGALILERLTDRYGSALAPMFHR